MDGQTHLERALQQQLADTQAALAHCRARSHELRETLIDLRLRAAQVIGQQEDRDVHVAEYLDLVLSEVARVLEDD